MGRVKPAPTIMACVGMVSGVVLLSFAAILTLMAPSTSFVAELEKEGLAIVTEGTRQFMQAAPRRLGPPVVPPIVPPTTTTTVTITTHDSMYDSLDHAEGSSSSSGSSLESFKSSESQSSLALPLPVEQTLGAWLQYTISVWANIAFMICFSVCYHQCAVEPILEEYGTLVDQELESTGINHFKNPIFGCFGDVWVCIHGLFCPIVRMAHTNSVAGICGYWESVLCFSWCACMTGGMLGPCCLLVYWRRQVKEVMGLEYHFAHDLAMTILCPLCSLCQQATAVDRKMGYVVSGCCDVTPTGF